MSVRGKEHVLIFNKKQETCLNCTVEILIQMADSTLNSKPGGLPGLTSVLLTNKSQDQSTESSDAGLSLGPIFVVNCDT